MIRANEFRFLSVAYFVRTAVFAFALVAFGVAVRGQDADVAKKLQGFDAYMEQTLKDWNTPGVGVGIVVGDKLVFAKGYGYRDYEKKLPFTAKTLQPIASNSKLFTAVSAGMLVEEGKLTWDKPIKQSVPEIEFYNDQLNNNVTLRDMLSHRTGVTRHDLIWFKSDFTRKVTHSSPNSSFRCWPPTDPCPARGLHSQQRRQGSTGRKMCAVPIPSFRLPLLPRLARG